MTFSAGETGDGVLDKSAGASLLSPIGVSREMGSWAIFRTFLTVETRDVHLLRDLLRGGLAAEVLDQEPATCQLSLLIVSIMCTGMRIVRAWSAMARVMAGGSTTSRTSRICSRAVLELVDGLHEADVALLDEVQELEAAVRVLLGDRP